MIVANAGHEGAVVVEKVKSNPNANYGFNAETESFGDLVEAGVIDPTKVDPHRPPERCLHCFPAPHHRGADQRVPGEGR